MNYILKKALPVILAVSCAWGSSAYAAEFKDMPTDWTAKSVQKAIDNGFLNGYPEDNTFRPNNNITRAQMAALIVRCFGATKEGDISRFTDVSDDQWYYKEFSKAVQMGAFNGDNENHLNPNNPIRFEECFKAVACTFGYIANTDDKPTDLETQDLSVLDKFSDKDEVSDWAKPYVAAIVANGIWDGIDGKLTPRAYITRAQFAVVLDNLIETYITEPGEYTNIPEGNIMIKCGDVTITGLNTDDNVVISDGVEQSENGIKIVDSTVRGKLVVRGGGKNTSFSGYLANIAILNPGLNVELKISNLKDLSGYMCDNSSISPFLSM